MDYLVYVSHDAENLQFWLWLQDYTKRFYASPNSEQVLSPPWYEVEGVQSYVNASDQPPPTAKKPKLDVSEYEVKFDHAELPLSHAVSPQFDKQSFVSGVTSTNRTVTDLVDDANAQTGLKWQSCEFSGLSSRPSRANVLSHHSTL